MSTVKFLKQTYNFGLNLNMSLLCGYYEGCPFYDFYLGLFKMCLLPAPSSHYKISFFIFMFCYWYLNDWFHSLFSLLLSAYVVIYRSITLPLFTMRSE